MKIQFKPLQDQVWILTGASSGIGLTTARMAAAHGVRGLILIARSAHQLDQLALEINESQSPTRAIAHACDVADEQGLRHAAAVALQEFGGFDTWVNNAGVGVYARVREIRDEDHRRVFETNYWGVVHGSKIAVEQFVAQGGGCLITVGSTVGDVTLPLLGAYSATKHAVKSITDALRMELEEEGQPVAVTLVKPTSIDTPFPRHALNQLDDEPTIPPPVYAPELVARTILYAAQHPVRELFVGGGGKGFQLSERHMPRATHRFMERVTMRQMHTGKPRSASEALHRAGGGLRQRGDYEGHVRETSLYTQSMTHPRASMALLGVGAVAAAAMFLSRR